MKYTPRTSEPDSRWPDDIVHQIYILDNGLGLLASKMPNHKDKWGLYEVGVSEWRDDPDTELGISFKVIFECPIHFSPEGERGPRNFVMDDTELEKVLDWVAEQTDADWREDKWTDFTEVPGRILTDDEFDAMQEDFPPENSMQALMDLMESLGISGGEDCGNPDCPIHSGPSDFVAPEDMN